MESIYIAIADAQQTLGELESIRQEFDTLKFQIEAKNIDFETRTGVDKQLTELYAKDIQYAETCNDSDKLKVKVNSFERRLSFLKGWGDKLIDYSGALSSRLAEIDDQMRELIKEYV